MYDIFSLAIPSSTSKSESSAEITSGEYREAEYVFKVG
jgi:hypothetical protein